MRLVRIFSIQLPIPFNDALSPFPDARPGAGSTKPAEATLTVVNLTGGRPEKQQICSACDPDVAIKIAAKYRSVWETYYGAAHGLIFVVDSSDRLRMAVARDELWMLFDHKDVGQRQVIFKKN